MADATINIQQLAVEKLLVPIVGTSPLLMHRFSEKAKKKMLDAAQGKKSPKEPKDPQAEYEAALYKLPDGGYGFPVVAFKAATVGAARFYGREVKMTELRQFLFMTGEPGSDLVRILGEPVMREDVCRVGNGSADLRYRPEFREWRTTLTVMYVTSSLSRDAVLSLIDAGGLGVGVGEWRPEKRGVFGCYRVDLDRDIEVIS